MNVKFSGNGNHWLSKHGYQIVDGKFSAINYGRQIYRNGNRWLGRHGYQIVDFKMYAINYERRIPRNGSTGSVDIDIKLWAVNCMR